MAENYTSKLQTLLKKLFQFESADLDFGIYRIMNQKRDVIERFIEKDLIAAVDTEFGKATRTDKAQLLAEVEALAGKLGIGVDDDPAAYRAMAQKVPALQPLMSEFEQKRIDLRNLAGRDEHKAEVFNHIYQFFSRYYDNGDFMSMRRYSAKQKFAVPYNGEEVLLHWANKDQYYIKTGEYFFNYAFQVGEYTVRFRIVQAQTAMNNTKAENRFFILNAGEDNVTYDAKTKELVILFEYRALNESQKASMGARNVQDGLNEQAKTAILAVVPDDGLKAGLSREIDGKTPLVRHIATYAKRNTTDYFIHKDLSGFLTQELDFYIKNEMFDLDDLGTEKEVPIEQYLNRVRVMKAISLKIIAFLAQIEDFQKKLFQKKKFVMSANYCMTLDRVPAAFYPEIVRNADQIAEWKALYGIGESEGQVKLDGTTGNTIDEEFLKNHPYLMLDTKFFPLEFKYQILANFDDLDDATGGLLVKSENWQALNLLQERYREQVKCIYIDPPYNTGKDNFLYKDNYFHSSWLSMLENRLSQSYFLLAKNGLIGISNDDNETNRLREICNMIFGSNNFVGNLIWNTEGHTDNQYEIKISHEYISLYCVDKNKVHVGYVIDSNTRDKSNLWKGYAENSITKNGPGNPPSEVVLPVGFPVMCDSLSLPPSPISKEFYDQIPRIGYITRDMTQKFSINYPIRKNAMKAKGGKIIESCTVFSGWANVNKLKQFITNGFNPIIEEDGILDFYLSEKGVIYYKKERQKARNIFSVLRNLGTTEKMRSELENMGLKFSNLYPKPKQLINYIISIEGCEAGDYVMDYFAGSGTTAHALINLNREDHGNRKYILVEMANYFDSVIKPRIEKFIFSTEWKDGKPQNTDGTSHMFKYLTLEQYEDTLNNIEFLEGGSVQKTLMDIKDYVLRYMLDFETRESPCHMNVTKLERPFDYTLRITKDFELRNEIVDLVETFNYLLGLKVKRIRTFAENKTTYRVVHGETLAGQLTTIIWRTTAGLDLRKDKTFIEETLLKDPKLKAKRIFINGDFHVEDAHPIELEFQRLMGA